jgi:DNA-binding IclR family transcriptional regulator
VDESFDAQLIADGGNLDEAAKAATPRTVPAVTRAIAILRLLAASRTPLGVNMIATKLHIVPSTCLHILRVLVAEGLVAVDVDTKRYTLDAGLLTLARSYLRSSSFGQRVQPSLDDIVTRFPVTALATRIMNLDSMVVVATARAQAAMHIAVELGSRQPALMSATGRCLAAFGNYPPKQIEIRFTHLRWDNPPSRETWLAEVGESRRRGYSVDRGNFLRGVTVIAAPVLDAHGAMVHALVALGFSDEITEEQTLRIGGDLRVIGVQLGALRD